MAAALEAGAREAMAIIDCDAAIASHRAGARGKTQPPFTLSQAVQQRKKNIDEAGDRRVADILRSDGDAS